MTCLVPHFFRPRQFMYSSLNVDVYSYIDPFIERPSSRSKALTLFKSVWNFKVWHFLKVNYLYIILSATFFSFPNFSSQPGQSDLSNNVWFCERVWVCLKIGVAGWGRVPIGSKEHFVWPFLLAQLHDAYFTNFTFSLYSTINHNISTIWEYTKSWSSERFSRKALKIFIKLCTFNFCFFTVIQIKILK